MNARAWLRRCTRGRRFLTVAAGTRLVAIGDSHCRFWSGHDSVHAPDRLPGIVTCHVGPGLAWNLIEPAAQTRAGRSVLRALRDLAAQDYAGWVLLCFGEIDLRAHVLKHAADGDLRARVERLVERYLAFVANARHIHPRIALWGPGASQPADMPDNPDFPAIGSEAERNAATVLFTALLEERGDRAGVPVLSLLPLLLDEQGRTRRELLFDGYHIGQALMPAAQRLVAEALPCDMPAVAKAS
jgi:lysophospholipase L1-like esterase